MGDAPAQAAAHSFTRHLSMDQGGWLSVCGCCVQNERRMLEMLMNNRARLLTHMAVLRTCSRVALCHECHAPAAPDSLATSPAA